MKSIIAPHLLDIFCLAISIVIFSLYHVLIWWKLKKNPLFTLYGATKMTRTAWVINVMEEKKDILAVQTLRNATMAATFLASTAILLAVGVLTLSGQGDKLGETWHAVNVFGSKAQSTMTLKLLVILANLFIAFFSFSFSIRLYNHVGFMINVPEDANLGTSFTFVAMQLNKAAKYFHTGILSYYFLIPLVFWLFGPLLMVASTIAMVLVIYFIEKTPRLDCGYLASFYKQSCSLPPE